MLKLILTIGLLALLGCSSTGSGASSSSPPRAPAPTAQPRSEAKIEGQITYSGRLRVGQKGTVSLALRNTGTAPAALLEFDTNKEFGDAWIVESAVPAWQSNRANGDRRSIVFEGLAPGEAFTYQLQIVGKTVGERDFKLTLVADRKYMTTFSGRAVVLP